MRALKRAAKKTPAVAAPKKPKINWAAGASMSRADESRVRDITSRLFMPALPPKGLMPPGMPTLANDEALKAATTSAKLALDQQIIFAGGWSSQMGQGYGAFSEGQAFLGYPYLSELAQRPEYRVIVETIATEMTRKWIKVKSTSDDQGKAQRISQLEDELKRLKVSEHFGKAAEQDGYFGRGHLYLDFDDAAEKNPQELKTPVGDGMNDITKMKVRIGSLKRIQPVEPVWCYPTQYNSTNPLAPNWYQPDMWYAMGTEVHSSRLLTFVGREVPDLLKPAYSFGGLSMTQMAKPYVDNWLRTRQSVSDLVHAFTVWCLSTDLGETLTPGGEQLFTRVQMFNNIRDNKGMMITDKETEELSNISASLSGLDALQAQSQEHMMSVARIPAIKFTGLQPQGLNASSEGEIRAFYDTIRAKQGHDFDPNLLRVFRLAQMNLWGMVDPDLTYEWVDLWQMDAKQKAEIRKIEADTDIVLIDGGVIDSQESRERVAADEDSPHAGLDLNKVIEPPGEMGGEEGGMAPPGLTQGGGLGGSQSEYEPKPSGGMDKEVVDVTIPFGHDAVPFEEGKHPRAANGQFGSGGGGAAPKSDTHSVDHKVAEFLKTPMKGTSSERNKIRAFRKEVGEHNLTPMHMQALKNLMLHSRAVEKAKKEGKPAPSPPPMSLYEPAVKLPTDLGEFVDDPKPVTEAIAAQAMKDNPKLAAFFAKEKEDALTSGPDHKATKAELAEVTPQDIEKAKHTGALTTNGVPAVADFNEKWTGANTPKDEAGLKEKVVAFKKMQVEKDAYTKAKNEASTAAAKQKAAALAASLPKDQSQALQALAEYLPDTGSWFKAGQTKLEKLPDLAKHISPPDCAAILAYTGSHFGQVNKQLREGQMDEGTYKYAAVLNRALKKMPKYDGVTRRGINVDQSVIDQYKPGMVIEERGFTSTSMAKGFSGNLRLEVHGKSGRDVSKISNHKSEAEVLFPAGTRFKVESNKGGHVVLREVVVFDDE